MIDSAASKHSTENLSGLPFFFRLVCGVASRIQFGAIKLVLPDGRVLRFKGETETDQEAVIVVKDFAFARRTMLGGDIGFFESYADGQWESLISPNVFLSLAPQNAITRQDIIRGIRKEFRKTGRTV